MDPFSSDGELLHIHTAFTQGQYNLVLSDYQPSDFSPENHLTAQILQYRAQLALGQTPEVLAATAKSKEPDLAAIHALAEFNTNASTTEAEQLAESSGENLTVQICCGTVLARAGEQEQALQLLAKHQGSLDAVALIVQIHLAMGRTDLAQKEAKSARAFAGDALGVNLAEGWVGMRVGGENYQKSFYVFEELAQSPSSASATSLIAQAVSELHMGRFEEAETALGQALALEPENSTALANKVVLDILAGRDSSEDRGKLEKVDKEHEMLADLAAKREAFKAATDKYNPKFEA